ncbi:MAG: isoprenyl transferase [Flavobacteriaceae bacterium]
MIDETKLPNHIAVIMDGNGRWAKSKGKNRVFGHRNGTEAVQKIVEAAAKIGVKHLTLYAFSTENWNRPKQEVSTLMDLLIRALRRELKKMLKNNIQLKSIGDISKLPVEVEKELRDTIDKTKSNDGMVLTLALNYGARQELTQAMQQIAAKVKNNIISPENVDETIINEHLYTQNLPPVDLLIRTSGEQRISNFLLWQIAYAELYFSEVLWPDFNEKHFEEAIICYQKRERRFGKTSEQLIS